jgi:hypothetical protein
MVNNPLGIPISSPRACHRVYSSSAQAAVRDTARGQAVVRGTLKRIARLFSVTATLGLMAAWFASSAGADEPSPLREIFVPFADLHVILAADAQRVFMSRQEYETLAAQAKKATALERKTQPSALLSADYTATIEEHRARLLGTLVVVAPDDKVSAVDLDLSGIALRLATLDGKPAALGRNPNGLPVLFVRGAGRHELKLEILAPLETAAAQRTLTFQIPTPPATRLRLAVPGHVEIKSGATVIDRSVDEAKQETNFDLLPMRGQNSLVLSLNNRELQKERVVVSHAVMVDEMTTAYERLHATMSMSVLHGGADQFRFVVPAGFEVTSVTAPEVARWAVTAEGGQRVLDVRLREPATATVSLGVVAIRTPAVLEDWHSPKLTALDVAGQASVVGLIVENRLKPSALLPKNLISTDADVLAQTVPEIFSAKQAGALAFTAVAAFYAPQADYDLTARFHVPPAELRVLTNVLLTLEDKGLSARGGFVVANMTDKLLGFDFTAPAGWQVANVTPEGGQPLPVEMYPAADGGARIHVRLPRAVALGQSQTVHFRAVNVPEGWFDDWRTKPIVFPAFQVVGAARDIGAIAVQPRDDMVARADTTDRLTPLDANEKSKYGLEEVPTDLAYRYDAPPYKLNLSVARVAPRLTARALSFFRVEPALLTVHDELVYDVSEARTSRLSFALPAETPAELAIRGLDGVAIKESTSKVVDGLRRWTVQLAEPRRAAIRLAIDFQQPQDEKATDAKLPLVRALDVTYQSGTIAVEGSLEREVQVKTALRKVDVGELAEADYQPGRRLLGAFGYVGDTADVKLAIARPAGHELPPVIVERAELVTALSARGRAQTAARFQLRAKAQMIEVSLPPRSTLWSAYLDGQPALPQRVGESLLINLPAATEANRRDLQLVYETPVNELGLSSSVELPAPQLLLRGEGHVGGSEVPLADLVWRLSTPGGFKVVRSDGTVFAEAEATRPSPLWVAMRNVGGVALLPFARSHYDQAKSVDRGVDFAKAPTSAVPSDAKSEPASGGERSAIDEMQKGDKTADATKEAKLTAPEYRAPEGKSEATHATPPPAAKESPPPPTAPAPAPLEDSFAAQQPPEVSAPQLGFGLTPSKAAGQSQWALEGLRSLPIELQANGNQTTFQSLGESPRLIVTVVDRRRFDLLAWAVGVMVFFFGALLTRRPPGVRFRYLLAIMVTALALPLALPWTETIAPLCDMAFFAACWLVPYYLAAAVLKRLANFGRKVTQSAGGPPRAAATASALIVLFAAAQAWADGPATQAAGAVTVTVPVTIPVPVPVTVPADAIIVPYDPEKEDPLQMLAAKPGEAFLADMARKILVPYAKYVELRKAAQSEGKQPAAPPTDYALAGAAFTARLDGGESLVVSGHLEVDVLVDRPVSIPIALVGGVLVKATVDGAQDVGIDLAPEVKPRGGKSPASEAPLRLLVTGPGRTRVDLAIRVPLRKRGGWQIAEGRLPVAPAAALTLEVAKAGTEVTLAGGVDRGTFETKRDDETVETALAADGAFQVQWRAKTGAAPVDQSLTARSAVVLNVQEDGLRLIWGYHLEFRRGQRESFRIDMPEGYLVEKVNGANVRGWRLVEAEGKRRLEITLLKAAQEAESFSIVMSRRGAVGGALAEFTVPVLSVEGAAQQSGEVAIRRSPLLELRTEQTAGVSRADNAAASADADIDSAESPLGILPYQAYRFPTSPFTVKLTARPVAARVAAELQTVLKISQRQRTLESRIRVRVQDRPIYRVRIALPKAWKLDRVDAPTPHEWVVGNDGDRRLLSLYFAAGQRRSFDVVLSGALGEYAMAKAVELPRIEVVDADEQPGPLEQSGEIVVQADPSLNVRAENLKNCETELLSRANAWLVPAQQALARVALVYRTPDYAAQINFTPRTPSIHCDTITNVRVTPRAVEETILLEFHIQEAGIRAVSFVLPNSMGDARISAPMLRQKTIEPVADDAAKRVRVRLELQDEVMGDLRVLVENDRPMTGVDYVSPIPTVETGETDHRYVTLESAGRDEIVVAAQNGVDPLGQEQAEWRMLTGVLGRGLTQAFLVRQNETEPSLALKAKDRAAVETAGARIGLAKTTLVVDAGGAYRGEQLYRINNSLEQYLEIQLPERARLWTAHVAGEPVKPAAAATADVLRIPLVKTAPGDADYAVVVKYGGELGALASLDRVDFPLIRTRNIHVELSQVELHVPQTHRWFDFGGNMRLVQDEGDLAADWLAYNTRQIGLALRSIKSSDEYSRARATNNLKALQAESEQLKKVAQSYRHNEQLSEQLESNTEIQKGLEQELQTKPGQSSEGVDNRATLRGRFAQQSNSRSSDVVNRAGENFFAQDDAHYVPPQGQAISGKWLAKNKLGNDTLDKSGVSQKGLGAAKQAEPNQSAANQPPGNQQAAQPAKPPASFSKIQETPSERRKDDQDAGAPSESDRGQRQLERYKERLSQLAAPTADMPNAPQAAAGLAPSGERGGGGMGGRMGAPAGPTPAEGQEKPAVLASLDVELHARGVKYAFTTPRGDVEISARAVSRPLLGRATRLALLAVGVVVIVGVARGIRRTAARFAARPAASAQVGSRA